MILIPVGTLFAGDINGIMEGDGKAGETLVPYGGLSAVEDIQGLSQQHGRLNQYF